MTPNRNAVITRFVIRRAQLVLRRGRARPGHDEWRRARPKAIFVVRRLIRIESLEIISGGGEPFREILRERGDPHEVAR
jgi:hypothetical protein